VLVRDASFLAYSIGDWGHLDCQCIHGQGVEDSLRLPQYRQKRSRRSEQSDPWPMSDNLEGVVCW